MFKLITVFSFVCISGLIFYGVYSRKKDKPRTVYLQPFDDVNTSEVNRLYGQLQKIIPGIQKLKSISLTKQAYYAPRNRYRADSLIAFFKRRANKGSVIIGITNKDISTTKGKYQDFGVMGLAYQPGRSCVISTYRLNKIKLPAQTYKVAIHELGHTQDLPHCKIKTCYMRDAEGGNPLDDEIEFCDSCKRVLKNKGWLLQ